MPTRISIDPGIDGTGYAIWSARHWTKCVPPLETGIIYGEKEIPWEQNIIRIADSMLDILANWETNEKMRVTKAYIELPSFWGLSSARGLVSATTAKGDDTGPLLKLCILIGALHRTILNPVKVEFVPVIKWKGQLPKQLVEERLIEKLGPLGCKSHAIDAIGIGLWAKGHF